MPWEEREWAKWTDEERDRYLGTSVTRRGGTGGAPVGSRLNRSLSGGQMILAFGVIAAVLAYAVHHVLKRTGTPALGSPMTALRQPAYAERVLSPTREPMRDLPSTLRRGTYVTSSGTLGSNVSGVVIVEGRWGNGPWYRLATAPATNGRYRVRFLLARPGLVHLRIALPNGNYLVATTHVT